jgi:hypothetical protein
MSFFFLFFYKIREQEGGSPSWGGLYQGEGEDVRKGCGRVNMVEVLCTHVCKWKMRHVKTIQEMGGIKENN